ncbi:MAG: integrase [Thermodesulfovibrionales bacterium]
MSKAVIEVYEAFKSAGVPEDKASAAAKAVADIGQEDRLARIEKEIMDIEGDIKVIKWMLGVIIAGIASLIVKSFF